MDIYIVHVTYCLSLENHRKFEFTVNSNSRLTRTKSQVPSTSS